MNNFLLTFAYILLTIIVYFFAAKTYQKYKKTFLLPIFIVTITIVLVLLLFNISYETYMIGGKWISELLGPAVVALAYPLYNQRKLLKQLLLPLTIGTITGAIVGITTGVLFVKWLNFDIEVIYSMVPKSVTTPVAVVITESFGGIPALAAVFVSIAGITGVIFHQFVYKYGRINNNIARGIGMGCASHAIGTAVILESSETEAAISSIAMIVSAIIVSLISPWLVSLLI